MKLLAILLYPLGLLLRGKRAGATHSIRNTPELNTATAGTLNLASPAFAHQATIPLKHATMDMGPNISPALTWNTPPPGTQQLLLVMEDIDTPTAKPGRHMAALFAPEATRIEEGELTADNKRFTFLPDHRGRTGYQGPRPLPGHGTHHYHFHLYALNTIPDTTASNDMETLLPQLTGRVLASGHLEGMLHG